MKDRTLHLPPDFELTDGVRLLAAALVLGADGPRRQDMATLIVLRLMLDWARQRKAFRPLHATGENWAEEPLARLIEQACGWAGAPGALVALLLSLRILALTEGEDGVKGLVLPGFEEDNAHLLPGWLSMQQKGGRATALRARMGAVEEAVPQTQQLLETQGVTLFADASVPPSDQKDALSLVMRIDTACGRSLRNASEYRGEQDLLRAALHRARRHPAPEIEAVLAYLMHNARNPAVPKETAVVLRDFDTLLRFACPTSAL